MTACRVALCATVLALGGCGSGEADTTARTIAPRVAKPAPSGPLRIKPLHCPPGAANCRSATGRVVYVEAKDPDGDGDAHLVLASAQQVSGPGITVIDLERDRRPHPLPRLGDLVAAAGPVYRGSYGQHQIEATAIHVKRSPRR